MVRGLAGSTDRVHHRVRAVGVVLLATLLVTGGLFNVAPAAAVDDEGLFELDGNVEDEAVAGDDWDALFPSSSSTAALDTFFQEDASDSGGNYFQGSSQDREPLADWNYAGASAPQHKDNITNAYGASYISPTTGNRIAYVGADRFANNGDSELGFWFFQDEVSLGPVVNNVGSFVGEHRANDVLVLADWASDGSTSGIEVWVWDPTATNNLRQIAPSTTVPAVPTATCPAPGVSLIDDRICAIGNTSPITPTPWPYTPKFGTTGTMPAGSFFEARIDLTALVGNVCFTSLVAETRSSHSTATSTLQDLVLASFNTCPPPTIETTSNPGGPQPRGTSVVATDTAQFTGTFGAVTGTADFFLCGPGQVTAATSTDGCPTGGTQTGNDVAIVGGSATSATTPTLQAAGLYCWRAVYTPAAGASYAAGSHTNASSECFTLRDKATPVIATSSSPTGEQPRGATSVASDRATLIGALGVVTGTVDFFLCGPGLGAAADVAAGCPTGGTPFGDDRPIVAGTATSLTTGTLSVAGLYCWRVEYAGDANYLSGSHTNADTECFTLRDKAPAVIETTSTPTGDQARGASVTATDSATFTGPLGAVAGTADFFLCGPGQLALASATTGCASSGTRFGDDRPVTNGTATSAPTGTLSTPGLYCWRVEYSGDANHLSGSHTNNGSECFTLLPADVIDLAITKTDDRDPINLGESVTYTLTAVNRSLVDATGVVVSDELPADVRFEAASPGCVAVGQLVTCSVGSLLAGVSRSFTLTVTPLRVGRVTNVARVAGIEQETDLTNNVDDEDTTVQQVLGAVVTNPAPPVVSPSAPSVPSAPSLPRTGGELVPVTLLGLALVLVGSALSRSRGRRPAEASTSVRRLGGHRTPA